MDELIHRLHAEYEERNWWFVAKNRIVLSLLERYLAGGPAGGNVARVCDIGCGAGGLLARLAERYEASGIDMSPIAVEYCRRRALDARLGALPDRVPFEPGTFDGVVATEVLEHVPDDAASVRALAGLLRPGGVLVCTVPAHQWLWSRHDELNHHQRRYSKRGFRGVFEGAPLRPELLSYSNFGLFPVMAGVRVIGRLVGLDGGGAGFKPPAAPVNAVCRAIFEAEKHVLPHLGLPMGGSLISVHRRV